MRNGGIGLGIVLASLALGAARAQEPATRAIAATVDAAGRVLPDASGGGSPDRRTSAPATPCPTTTAMDPALARSLVAEIAAKENFPPDLALSVAKIESQYASTALSPKGAFGLMQLMPDTARRFDVDLCDAEGNVRGGIRYLRALQTRYRNPLYVLAAYNAGEEAVRRAKGVPPFPETVRFVADVMNDLAAWPITGSGRPDVVAANATRDGVEGTTLPASSANDASRGAPSAQWSAGFVMHIQ